MWVDTRGEIDIFITGVGSDGALQGMGQFLKEKALTALEDRVEKYFSTLFCKNLF